MLATIREYADERLAASQEAETIARRHAEAYLALAEDAAPHLLGLQGQPWNDRLEREHDNLRAALDWIVRTDEGLLGLRMVAALWRFWQVRGHLVEGHERTHRVLELPSVPAQEPALRARAEGAAGGISYWLSRPDSTHRHYAAALAAAREAGDRKLLADALYDYGFAATPGVTHQQQRYATGRAPFEESLALYRDLDDRAGIASSTWALAMSMAAVGDREAGAVLAEQSLELSRELGDPFRTGWAAHLVSLNKLALGQPDESLPYVREAFGIFQAAGDQTGILLVLVDIATLARQRGQMAQAWRFLGAAQRIRVEDGVDLFTEVDQTEFLGWNVRLHPETDEEGRWFDEGQAVPRRDVIEEAGSYLGESGAANDRLSPVAERA